MTDSGVPVPRPRPTHRPGDASYFDLDTAARSLASLAGLTRPMVSMSPAGATLPRRPSDAELRRQEAKRQADEERARLDAQQDAIRAQIDAKLKAGKTISPDELRAWAGAVRTQSRPASYGRGFVKGAAQGVAGVPRMVAIGATAQERSFNANVEREQARIKAFQQGVADGRFAPADRDGQGASNRNYHKLKRHERLLRTMLETPMGAYAQRAPLEELLNWTPAPIENPARPGTGFSSGELLDADAEKKSFADLYALGDEVEQFAASLFGAPDPALAGEWGQEVSQGVGQMMAILPAAVAGGAVAGPVGAMAASVGVGGAQMGSAMFEDALRSGADLGTALQASGYAAALGTTEAVPILRMLNRAGGPGAKAFFRNVLQSAGEEAFQEFVQTVGENMIARGEIDADAEFAPERGRLDGAPFAASVGAGAGGLTAVFTESLARVLGAKGAAGSQAMARFEQLQRQDAQDERFQKARAALEASETQDAAARLAQPSEETAALDPTPREPAPSAGAGQDVEREAPPEPQPEAAPSVASPAATRPGPTEDVVPLIDAEIDENDRPVDPTQVVFIDRETGAVRPYGVEPETVTYPPEAVTKPPAAARPTTEEELVQRVSDDAMSGRLDQDALDSIDDATALEAAKAIDPSDRWGQNADDARQFLERVAQEDRGGGEPLSVLDPEAAAERDARVTRFAKGEPGQDVSDPVAAIDRLSRQPKSVIRAVAREYLGRPIRRGEDPLQAVRNEMRKQRIDPLRSATVFEDRSGGRQTEKANESRRADAEARAAEVSAESARRLNGLIEEDARTRAEKKAARKPTKPKATPRKSEEFNAQAVLDRVGAAARGDLSTERVSEELRRLSGDQIKAVAEIITGRKPRSEKAAREKVRQHYKRVRGVVENRVFHHSRDAGPSRELRDRRERLDEEYRAERAREPKTLSELQEARENANEALGRNAREHVQRYGRERVPPEARDDRYRELKAERARLRTQSAEATREIARRFPGEDSVGDAYSQMQRDIKAQSAKRKDYRARLRSDDPETFQTALDELMDDNTVSDTFKRSIAAFLSGRRMRDIKAEDVDDVLEDWHSRKAKKATPRKSEELDAQRDDASSDRADDNGVSASGTVPEFLTAFLRKLNGGTSAIAEALGTPRIAIVTHKDGPPPAEVQREIDARRQFGGPISDRLNTGDQERDLAALAALEADRSIKNADLHSIIAELGLPDPGSTRTRAASLSRIRSWIETNDQVRRTGEALKDVGVAASDPTSNADGAVMAAAISRDGETTIWLSEEFLALDETQQMEFIAHEYGHALEYSMLEAELDTAEGGAVYAAARRAVAAAIASGDQAAIAKALSDETTALMQVKHPVVQAWKAHRRKAGTRGAYVDQIVPRGMRRFFSDAWERATPLGLDERVDPNYEGGFSEWFANSVARSVTTSKESQTVLAQFFRRIAEIWRDIAKALRAEGYADKRVEKWLVDVGVITKFKAADLDAATGGDAGSSSRFAAVATAQDRSNPAEALARLRAVFDVGDKAVSQQIARTYRGKRKDLKLGRSAASALDAIEADLKKTKAKGAERLNKAIDDVIGAEAQAEPAQSPREQSSVVPGEEFGYAIKWGTEVQRVSIQVRRADGSRFEARKTLENEWETRERNGVGGTVSGEWKSITKKDRQRHSEQLKVTLAKVIGSVRNMNHVSVRDLNATLAANSLNPILALHRYPVEDSRAAEPAKEAATPEASQNDTRSAVTRGVADSTQDMIAAGQAIRGPYVMAVAREVGGPLSEGRYTVEDVYNGVELGLNSFLAASYNAELIGLDAAGIKQIVKRLRDDNKALLPTQNRRDAKKDELQAFSTPPDYAAVIAWLASIRTGQKVLEPSAGNGGIATFAGLAGADVMANEIDPQRRVSLETLRDDSKKQMITEQTVIREVTAEDGEQIGNLRPGEFDRVVMNPPFSAAGQRGGKKSSAVGARHVEQGLRALKPGGRLVAIVGQTLHKQTFDRIKKTHQIRAVIRVKGDKIYRKMGTTYDTTVLVIDKTGRPHDDAQMIRAEVDTLEDLIDVAAPARTPLDGDPSAGADGGADRSGGEPGRGSARGPAGDGSLSAADGSARPRRQGDRRNIRDEGAPARRSGSRTASDRGGELRADSDSLGPARSRAVSRAERRERESAGAFTSYEPSGVTVEGAQPHPAKLVESNAMATVQLPTVAYEPSLRDDILDDGKLSEAQIENVIYAGAAHSETLGDGKTRKGYFIGDGTGVGKGRQIAGIMADNVAKGRKRHVWVSKNRALYADAERDARDVDVGVDIFNASDSKAFAGEMPTDAVIYTTYDALRAKGTEKTRIAGEKFPHVARLVRELGEDFDGVVVFDESHQMANAAPMDDGGWKKKPSDRALAAMELQERLPNARIVYVSATGATEVANLGYLARLGLWGPGTAFATRSEFLSQIERGGTAAMELVARDMKQLGVYLARSISYDGVEYEPLVHPLAAEQRDAYDAAAEAWTLVSDNLDAVFAELMPGASKTDVEKQRGRLNSYFWGTHQRFFNQVLTSMQMPTVLKSIRADLEAGLAPVIQITNTGEAAAKRALDSMQEGDTLEDLDVTPRKMIMTFVESAFPIYQMEEFSEVTESGNEKTGYRIAKDSNGDPIVNPEAVAQRDALLDRLARMQMPDAPLDMILDEFGHDAVAEITGRTQRVVREDGRRVIQRRSQKVRDAEVKEFADGKRDILVFSEAGGTGQSYHAGRKMKNQKRRSHYILQAGWRADSAVQGFGRTHRSNQSSAPVYKLVQTDLAGHKRFVATIARRLDQLGALTKGQRDTSSSGLFSAADNLESPIAAQALNQLLVDIKADNETSPVGLEEFEAATRLDLGGDLSKITTANFLNRLMAMPVDMQDRVFEAFVERLELATEAAREAGTLDAGIETIRAESAEVVEEATINTDEKTGAETKYLKIRLVQERKARPWAAVANRDGVEFWAHEDGRIIAQVGATPQTDRQTGVVRERVRILDQSERGNEYRLAGEWRQTRRDGWRRVTKDDAEALWAAAEETREKTKTVTKHMITGALLPIYDRLPATGKMQVERITLDSGDSHLGRIIGQNRIKSVLKGFGYEPGGGQTMTPEQMAVLAIAAAKDGGIVYLGERGAIRVMERRVGGEPRLEVMGASSYEFQGLQEERIDYRMRYFIPDTPAGRAALGKIIAKHPIESINKRGQEVDLDDYAEGSRTRLAATPAAAPAAAVGDGSAAPQASTYAAQFERNYQTLIGGPKQPKRDPGALLSWFDRIRESRQDSFIAVMRMMQEAQRRRGRYLTDAENVYGLEKVYAGKVGDKMSEVQFELIEPILEDLRSIDMTVEQLDEYLAAKHAPERNAQIARINPKMPDGGSGILTADARATVAKYEGQSPAQDRALKAIRRRMRLMRKRALQWRVETGLMSKAQATAWLRMYRDYVPLKGWGDISNAPVDAATQATMASSNTPLAGGNTLSVRGPESKRALGRGAGNEAAFPFVHFVTDIEESIIRGEKNVILQSLLRMARSKDMRDFLEEKKVETRRVFNPVSGLVEEVSRKPLTEAEAPNHVTVKENGKEKRIRINDPDVAGELKKTANVRMEGAGRLLQLYSQFFSATQTSWSPDFVFVNMLRDLGAFTFTFGRFKIPGGRRKVLYRYFGAAVAAARGQVGKYSGEWGKWYKRYRRAGGKISFFDLGRVESKAGALEREAKASEGKLKLADYEAFQRMPGARYIPISRLYKSVSAIADFVETFNLAIDNALRLALFRVAVESGVSDQEAAAMGRDVTVDFNKKGFKSTVMNAYFPFTNAGIQGTETLLRAVRQSRDVQRAMGLLVALGMLQEFWHGAMGEPDDDDVLPYDKLPTYTVEHNAVFMVGGEPVLLPLQYGINIPFNLGRSIARTSRAAAGAPIEFSPGNGAASIYRTVVEAFVPPLELSDDDDVLGIDMNTIAPTIVDPLVDMAENETFTGGSIRPENPFDDEGPRTQKYYRNVSDTSRMLADAVNTLGGGSDYERGTALGYPIDISPEYIDHFATEIAGAAGASVMRMIDIPVKLAQGEGIENRDIPVFRRFRPETSIYLDRSAAYDRMRAAETAEKAIAAALADRIERGEFKGPVEEISDEWLTKNRARFRTAKLREFLESEQATPKALSALKLDAAMVKRILDKDEGLRKDRAARRQVYAAATRLATLYKAGRLTKIRPKVQLTETGRVRSTDARKWMDSATDAQIDAIVEQGVSRKTVAIARFARDTYAIKKKLAGYRRQRHKAEDLPAAEREARLKDIEAKEQKIIDAFNKRFIRAARTLDRKPPAAPVKKSATP